MTYEDRERIFAKEYISTRDLAALYDIDESTASTLLTTIKRRQGDRLGKKGKIHIQDYFDYFRLSPKDYRPEMAVLTAKTIVERLSHELARAIKQLNDDSAACKAANSDAKGAAKDA